MDLFEEILEPVVKDPRVLFYFPLCWGPLYKPVNDRIRSGDDLILIVAPFIGADALRRIIECGNSSADLKVIVRWRPEDLSSGVSDLAIYPYLTERKIPLYLNHDIHLKLYIFQSNVACNTSANLTLRGLGYSDKPNIEVGQILELADGDWLRIYDLLGRSRRVDDSIYRMYCDYLDRCPKSQCPPFPQISVSTRQNRYSISSLPAMESVPRFMQCYLDGGFRSPEEIRRTAHDIANFNIHSGLSRSALDIELKQSFCSTPFVSEFVRLLRAEKSLRFGAVNAWIHEKCDDVPLPYKWEIKENTRIFYNWLEYFFEQIHWDRPHYSQVIHWTD